MNIYYKERLKQQSTLLKLIGVNMKGSSTFASCENEKCKLKKLTTNSQCPRKCGFNIKKTSKIK